MWTKTTLRLSETNTLTLSFLWTFLTRLVYFAEESSFNREPRILGPAGRRICGQYGIRGYKTRGGRRTKGYNASPEHPGAESADRCAGLPAPEAKGNIVSPPQVLRGRPGWLEPDWVVYGMRTKTGKNSAEIRARTRGR